MTKLDFINLAVSSTDNLMSFARFVQKAEAYCDPSNAFIFGADLARYNEIWFEMEIVNATALCEWEDEGRPVGWAEKWNAKYKSDAINLVEYLINLLEGRSG